MDFEKFDRLIEFRIVFEFFSFKIIFMFILYVHALLIAGISFN